MELNQRITSHHPIVIGLKNNPRQFVPVPEFLSHQHNLPDLKNFLAEEVQYWKDILQSQHTDLATWKKTYFAAQKPRAQEKLHLQKHHFDSLARHSHPTVLELGCGVGWFSTQLAHFHPATQVIGLDRSWVRLQKAFNLSHKLGLTSHCHFVCTAHLPYLSFVIPDKSIDAIFIFYPNPYPKHTQRHQRFHLSYEILECHRILKPGGVIVLTTNEIFFKNEVVLVSQLLGFNVSEGWYDQASFHWAPRTAFEKKYLAQNQRIYQIILERD